jgi:hypothetical protein
MHSDSFTLENETILLFGTKKDDCFCGIGPNKYDFVFDI